MTFDDFISKYNGKGIDYDNYYGFQCYDLAHQYATEVVGKDVPSKPAAKDLWDCEIDGYDKIANSPSGVPSKGDVVIWGTGVGQWGHVAVFISGDTNTFTSFDQNWPVGTLCHIQQHNYNGVLGWFHPQQVITDTVAVGKEVFETLVRKASLYDGFERMGYVSPNDIEARTEALQGTINGLNREFTELKQERDVLKDSLAVVQMNLDKCVYTKGDLIGDLTFIHTLTNSSWITYLRSRRKISDLSVA